MKLISKEEYILYKTRNMIEYYIEEEQLICPKMLNELIEQWCFDYEMDKEYRPEILKKIN